MKTRVRHATARRNCMRVLLAVYMAADKEGLYCHASDAEIAGAAGQSIDCIRSHLDRLETGGDIVAFGPRHGLNRRVIVLLDHPDAAAAMASIIVEARRIEEQDRYWQEVARDEADCQARQSRAG
jgi:hypothetical protein